MQEALHGLLCARQRAKTGLMAGNSDVPCRDLLEETCPFCKAPWWADLQPDGVSVCSGELKEIRGPVWREEVELLSAILDLNETLSAAGLQVRVTNSLVSLGMTRVDNARLSGYLGPRSSESDRGGTDSGHDAGAGLHRVQTAHHPGGRSRIFPCPTDRKHG